MMKQELNNNRVDFGASNLPAISSISAEVKILKKILEQMVDNERRRARNELIRIISFALIALLVFLGGGFWLSHDIVRQLKAESSSKNILPTTVESKERLSAAEVPIPARMANEQEPDLSMSPDTATFAEAHEDVRKSIADLEKENQILSRLLKAHDKKSRALALAILKKRNASIEGLHSSAQETPERKAHRTLTMQPAGEIPLRSPIPEP
jgi:hypothetical protein